MASQHGHAGIAFFLKPQFGNIRLDVRSPAMTYHVWRLGCDIPRMISLELISFRPVTRCDMWTACAAGNFAAGNKGVARALLIQPSRPARNVP